MFLTLRTLLDCCVGASMLHCVVSVATWHGEVTLKLAVDRYGAVDDLAGKSERFTSSVSLDAVHRLRRACDAVLVGVNTIIRDDPSLTVRRVTSCRQPLRVVIDPSGRTPRRAKVVDDCQAPTVFFCRNQADFGSAVAVEDWPNANPLDALLTTLQYKYDVRHLMVEGGPATARGFLASCLIDRAIIIRAPVEFKQPLPSRVHIIQTGDHPDVSIGGLKLPTCRWARLGCNAPLGGG